MISFLSCLMRDRLGMRAGSAALMLVLVAAGCGRDGLRSASVGPGTGPSSDAGDAGDATRTDLLGIERPIDVPPLVQPELVGLDVTPTLASAGVNTSTAFQALARFSSGPPQDVTASAQWTSSNSGVAYVTSPGTVRTTTAGAAQITASYMGRAAFATLMVTTGPMIPVLIGLDITPTLAFAGVNTTATFQALARFSSGPPQDVTASAQWTSSNSGVAYVTAPGTVRTTNLTGTAQITASYMGRSAFATLTVTSPPVGLVRLDITPLLSTTGVNTTAMFRAVARFSSGPPQDVTLQAGWNSNNTTVAYVTAQGTVRATNLAGTTQIRATYMGFSATANLTVTSAALTSVVVESPVSKLPRAMRAQLAAFALYADGSKQDVTAQASWSSNNQAVAAVSAQGEVTGASVGPATVTANFMGKVGSTTIEVTAATLNSIEITPVTPVIRLPATGTVIQRFFATGLYSDGTTSDVTGQVTWESNNPAVLEFAGGLGNAGVATAKTTGGATVTARLGAVTATTSVMVMSATITSIRVTPVNPTLPRDTTQAFTATATYSDGTSADVTGSAVWSSGDSAVISVSSTGVATGLAVGSTSVRATIGQVSGSAFVTVSAVTLTSLVVSPPAGTVPIGAKLPLTATANYSNNTTKDVTADGVWTSSNGAIASVSTSVPTAGQVTGVMVGGPVDITVSFGGSTGTAKITVSGATLSSIAITPNPAAVDVGLWVQLRAEGTYSDGTKADLTQDVTWSTSPAGIAFVVNSFFKGLAQGIAAGTTTVRAVHAASGKVGTGMLTVASSDLTSIVLTPFIPSRRVGISEFFGVAAVYANGTSRTVTSMSTLTSSDPTVAAFGQFGSRATCLKVGTTTITAMFMSKMDTTTLTCTDSAPVSVLVSPSPVTLTVGGPQWFQFLSASASYADGSLRTLSTFTDGVIWTSSDPAVARLTSFGGSPLVQALSAGTATITATYMGKVGMVVVTVVKPRVLTSLRVEPTSATIRVGQTWLFKAIAVYDNNDTATVTNQSTWGSSNIDAAKVPANSGQVTGIAMGTATITATYREILTGTVVSATATVTVQSATLTGITLSPASVKLVLGQTENYVATANYSDQSSHVITTVAFWSSSDATVAAISNGGGGFPPPPPPGRATALKAGTTTIKAEWMGTSGTVTLVATDAMLTGISVSPTTNLLRATEFEQYTAFASYSDGSSWNVTDLASWSSSRADVATVTSAAPGPFTGPGSRGRVSAVSSGMTTITAAYKGQMGSGMLTVTTAALTKVEVTPTTASVPVGQTLSFKATAVFADSNTKVVTNLAIWGSTAANVATVSNDIPRGMVTGKAMGTATIMATYQGLMGSTAITVP